MGLLKQTQVARVPRRHETIRDHGGDLLLYSPAIAWDVRQDSGTPPPQHPTGDDPRRGC